MSRIVTWVDGVKVVRDATAGELAPAPVTTEAVNAERDRRIIAGTDITVTGVVGVVALQGRDVDQRNMLGLVQAASLRLAQGDTTTVIKFRDRNNVDHDLVPAQVIEMWSIGAAWLSATIAASWAIKALDPIPQDYAADARWP